MVEIQGTRMTPRALFAATSGNVLEWYDFTVYGFLAPILGRIFFPSTDRLTSLLSAFAVLAVGYAARPIGSVIFGHIGDRFGRKPALMASVVIMGVGSVSIALLPSPARIGVTASVLLVVIRVVQGISVAGEYTASGILIVEEAKEGSRGFVGSWVAFAMMLGCVLGSAVPALMATLLSNAQMAAWGWRVAFLIGGAVAASSAVLRLHLEESPVIEGQSEPIRTPVLTAIKDYWALIIQMIVLLIPTAVIYFMIFVYAASYLTDDMGFSSAQALDISTVNLVAIAVIALLVGRMSDRFGPRAVFLFGAVGTLALAIPLWMLMHQDNLAAVFVGQLGFAAFNAIGWALSITVLTQIAPARYRCSVVALGYNACMALFGGTTPLIATYLVSRTGDDLTPALYVMVATALSLLVIVRLPALFRAAGRDAPTPVAG